jgi:hypothetical protein
MDMKENLKPSDPDIEAIGKEWLRRRLAGDLDRTQLAEDFPSDESVEARSLREMLREQIYPNDPHKVIVTADQEGGYADVIDLSQDSRKQMTHAGAPYEDDSPVIP